MNSGLDLQFFPLVNWYVFVPVPGCFYDYSPVVQFEVWCRDPPVQLFLLRVLLDIRGLLFFQMNLRNFLFMSVKKLLGILIGIALNPIKSFGRMDIFTMLIFTIREHGRFFHLLMSSSISFFKGLKFLLQRSLVSLLAFFLGILLFLRLS